MDPRVQRAVQTDQQRQSLSSARSRFWKVCPPPPASILPGCWLLQLADNSHIHNWSVSNIKIHIVNTVHNCSSKISIWLSKLQAYTEILVIVNAKKHKLGNLLQFLKMRTILSKEEFHVSF
jgi:hypothetical protein